MDKVTHIQEVSVDIPTGFVEGKLFESRFVEARRVDLWLPLQYEAGGRFPVLYMHDGQNVLVPELSYRGVDWGIDEAVVRLGDAIRAPIVAAVWNTPRRVNEYLPCRPLAEDFSASSEAIPNKGSDQPTQNKIRRGCGDPAVLERYARRLKGPVLSNEYLRFMVEELKPWVDRTFRTLTGPQDTALMGSSMGGLISLYGLCEYPQVFGGAGCVSTHWPLGGLRYMPYLRARLPAPGRNRIYFDHGTEDLDGLYPGFQRRVDKIMEERGYRQGVDWLTRVFPGQGHNEAAWRARVDEPLKFLFGKEL